MRTNLIGRQAVVIGARIGGLAAAGALAYHFEQVLVLERDTLPSEPTFRAGTPQARHVHGLLLSGQRALSELFPGFERDLARAGAVPLRAGLDIRVESPGYDPFPQRDLGWSGYAASRPTIERIVRRQVEGLANITLRPRCRVTDLVASPKGDAVTGVRCETGSGASEVLAADLVVDVLWTRCADARSAAIDRPTVARGDHDRHRSRLCHMRFCDPRRRFDRVEGIRTFGQPPHNSRGGLMLPLEGNRWMATLGGRHGDALPGDAEGFLAYAGSLRTPTIYSAIRHAKPLDGVARHGFPESVRRHFERLDGFPRGLLPIGDAICRFNPVYGQGMSVAAQEACLLKKLLERLGGDSDPIAGRALAFFAEVQSLLETPWSVAMLDFAFPNTRGQRPADFESTLKFSNALTHLAADDPAVHKLTLEVQHLLKPRSVYRDPALVQRVLAKMAEAPPPDALSTAMLASATETT